MWTAGTRRVENNPIPVPGINLADAIGDILFNISIIQKEIRNLF
jgi:hypothetical protein